MRATRHVPSRGVLRRDIAVAWIGATLAAQAGVVPDPGPDASFRSDRYAVTVATHDGNPTGSFVYVSRNSADHNLFPRRVFMASANHWTSYSADESVWVEVEALDKTRIRTCVVRPTRLAIQPEIRGNRVRFRLPHAGQVSVEIDEDDRWIEHPLLIFANPPETDPPSPSDAGVWDVAAHGLPPPDRQAPVTLYFGRGVHNLVRDHGIPLRPGVPLRSGDRVYLAPGAYVIGAFGSPETSRHIRLDGRGTISGLGEPFVKTKHRPLNPDASRDFSYGRHAEHLAHLRGRYHQVEGLVFTDPTHFNLTVGDDCDIQWVKGFGWHYSTDGLGLGDRSSARHCFLKVNDDAIKLYNDGIQVADCVIWQQFNGGVFQFSWGAMRVEHGLHVRNIDIIHDEHQSDANNRGLFSCVQLRHSVMRNLTFEDIRIEGDTYRLLDLRAHEGGRIENLILRRLSLEGRVTDASYLRARGGHIQGVTFEDCSAGGHPLRAPADIRLQLEGPVTPPVFR